MEKLQSKASQSAVSLRPSSQSSEFTGLTSPSPHDASVQFASQVALSPLVSHSSPASELTVPSGHSGTVQLKSQVVDSPASSQSSSESTIPSPQRRCEQSLRQVASGSSEL